MSPDPEQGFLEPEDEDLFDFPKVVLQEDGTYRPSQSSDATDLDMGLELGELDIDDLGTVLNEDTPEFEEEVPSLISEPVSMPAPRTTMALGDEMPENLDEDLFNFDASFLVQLSKDQKGKRPAAKAEPSNTPAPSAATSTPAGSDQLQLAPQKPKPAPKAPKPKKATKAKENTAELAEAEDVFDMEVPSGVLVPLGHEEGPRSRVVELLAIGFIVINTGLLMLAWRAGSQFQDTLLQVTQTLGESASQRVEQAPTNQREPGETLVLQPATDPRPAPILASEEGPADTNLDPQDLDSLPRITLRSAENLMDKGEFESARQRVYHLLANRDRYALEDDLVVESEILLARATQLQGRALLEAGR